MKNYGILIEKKMCPGSSKGSSMGSSPNFASSFRLI